MRADWTQLSAGDRAAWMTAWATWATAVVGLFALIAAAYAARQAYKVYKIESKRETRTQEERRRAQADLVSSWHDPQALGGVLGASLRNASTGPVYDVTVQWFHKSGDPRDATTIPVVPPAADPLRVPYPTGDPRRSTGVDSNDLPLAEEAANDFATDLRFRDASGNRWHRDVRGVLTRED